MNEYISDFETQKDPETGVMSVWAWAIVEVDNLSNIQFGNNIESWLSAIRELPNGSLIGFHNLKFDGSYILSYLLGIAKWQYNDNPKARKAKTVECLISSIGVHYNYRINFTKRKHVTIYDTLKIFNMSVSQIAKSFGIKEQKGAIDYATFRGYNYTMTPEEVKYITNDVIIVAKAIKQFRNEGHERNTIASNAMRYYKKNSYYSNYEFLTYFPHLDDDLYHLLKRAYKGGYCYVNPKFKGKPVGHGRVYDVNSLYPSVMSDPRNKYPVGTPVFFEDKYKYDPIYPLYIQFITVQFELKKGKIPTIQIKNDKRFNPREYVTTTGCLMVNLYLTNVDLEMFYECYNIKEIQYIGGYKFIGRSGIFIDYVNHFKEMKMQATIEKNAGKRSIAKLFLNSLYGKFGASNDKFVKRPYINDKGILAYQTVETPRPAKTVYVPVAAFVTAYARRFIQTLFIKNVDRCCYCDTDSLHLLGDEPPAGVKISDTEFNCMAHESSFSRAKFLGAKLYIEEDEQGNLDVKAAGLGQNEVVKNQITFDNFNTEQEYFGILKSKAVQGGVELSESTFKIRERGTRF